MLAYLFWHRPLDAGAAEEYEQALLAFHRSLAHSPPVGLCGGKDTGGKGVPPGLGATLTYSLSDD